MRHAVHVELAAQRIAAKLRPRDGGCVAYEGFHGKGGYPLATFGGGVFMVSQIVYRLRTGRFPSRKLVRVCRHRWCVAYEHLALPYRVRVRPRRPVLPPSPEPQPQRAA